MNEKTPATIPEPVVTLLVLVGLVLLGQVILAVRRARRAAASAGLDDGGPQARGDVFYDVLETFRDLGRLFLETHRRIRWFPGLRRIAVIAGGTVVEAVRRRVLLVVPLWFVVVALVALFLRPLDRGQDDYRLACRLFVFSQAVVACASVSLLAAFDLDGERRRRTLFTLLVKPVTRLELVAGKIAGHSLTAALLVACMGALHYGYFLWRDLKGVPEAAAEVERIRRRHEDDPAKFGPPEPALEEAAREGSLAIREVRDPAAPAEVFGLLHEGMRWMRSGSGQQAVAVFPNIRRADGFDAPRVVAAFHGLPIRTLLMRDHGRTADARGILSVPLSFLCLINPLGNPKDQVAVKYPLQLSEELTPILPESALDESARLDFRSRRIRVDPRSDQPFQFNAFFPVPTNMIDRGPLEIRVSVDTFGFYAGIDPAGSIRVTGVEGGGADGQGGELSPATPIRLEASRFRNRPAIMGVSEARDPTVPFSQVPGPKDFYPPDKAVWVFPGLHPEDLDGDRPAELRFKFIVDVNDEAFAETLARFTLEAEGVKEPYVVDRGVEENRPLVIAVPERFLNGKPLRVTVMCRSTSHILGFDGESARIVVSRSGASLLRLLEGAPALRPSPAWANRLGYAVAVVQTGAVIWMQATVLAAVGLTCGTFLSWPIALLSVVFTIIVGFVKTLIVPLGVGHEMWRVLYIMDPGMKETWYLTALKWTVFVLARFVALSGFLAPDLREYGEMDLISRGQSIPLSLMAGDAVVALSGVLPFLLLGYAVMRWREAGE
jgi:ABC-type transport system involved in multi-copper enzyme maturation permease subunit